MTQRVALTLAFLVVLNVFPVWAQDTAAPVDDISTLIFGLNSPEEAYRAESARTLGTMGKRAVPAIPQLILISSRFVAYPSGKIAHDAILSIGPPAVPTLCRGISSDNAERRQSLTILRDMGPKASKAVGCLTKAAQGKFEGAGFGSLGKLAKSGMIIGLRGTSNSQMPSATGQAPINTQKNAAVQDTYAQAYAIDALAEIGAPARSALPLLETLVTKYDTLNYHPSDRDFPRLPVRIAALNAILKIDPPTDSDINKLIEMTRSSAPGATAIAAKKLGYLAASDKKCVSALIDALRRPDILRSNDFATINEALRRIVAVHPEVVPMIQAAMITPKPPALENETLQRPGQAVAQEDVAGLIAIIKHDGGKNAYKITPLVKRLGEAPSSPEVIQALADFLGQAQLADAAASALGQQGPAAIPIIRALLDTPHASGTTVLAAIAKMGPGTLPTLRQVIVDGSLEGRYRAANALAEFPSEETISLLLERLAADPDQRFRNGIIPVFGKIGPRAGAARSALASLLKPEAKTDSSVRTDIILALQSIDSVESNKKALTVLRAAIAQYSQRNRVPPSNLTELVPAYLQALPTLQVPNHPPTSTVKVATHVQNRDALTATLRDSGSWLYVSDPISPINGTVIIDCTHKDSLGDDWSKL